MSSRRDFLKNLLLTGAAATFAPAIVTAKSLGDRLGLVQRASGRTVGDLHADDSRRHKASQVSESHL